MSGLDDLHELKDALDDAGNRECFVSGLNASKADLGICLFINKPTAADKKAKRLPVATYSRIEKIKGLKE